MKCSISTYYKILDAELYNFDDGYMQLNVHIIRFWTQNYIIMMMVI